MAEKASGFTLIELMVAMLMLSVGVLAMAGLQTSSLRQAHLAYMRTQAGLAAMQMAERMRVNIVGVANNDYMAISGAPGTAPTSCRTNNCVTSAEIAAEDRYEWLTSLMSSNDLPSAQGEVVCNDSNTGDGDLCTSGSLHTITVRWDGRRNGATGTGCDPKNSADLLCYQITFLP